MAELATHWHGWVAMGLHGFMTLPFWLLIGGRRLGLVLLSRQPERAGSRSRSRCAALALLDNKYYLDAFNERFFAGGARSIGTGLWQRGDQA